ncbi:MAG TPA: hypothetical protein VK638_52010, partial [Edaphobacter sp.]|nr:hypothetical protein [Edaphobacter sp.]
HPWSTRELLTQQQNRQRRYDRYEQVRALMRSGVPKAEIARQMSLDRRTVRKFMQVEIFPEAKPRIRRCIVDPYAEYLDRDVTTSDYLDSWTTSGSSPEPAPDGPPNLRECWIVPPVQRWC